MSAGVEEKNALTPNKKVRERPTGRDVGRYKHIDSWTYRRWAWEFLRRNKDFIKACIAVESGSDEQKLQVAQKFGLRRFKRYQESYNTNSKPTFDIGTISSISNPDSNEAIVKKIKIHPNEILIRIDLESALLDEQVLKKQLRLTEQHLRKHLAKLKQNQPQRINEHKHAVNLFGIYVRLLDLRAIETTYADCAKALCPGYEQLPAYLKKENFELQNRVGRRIKRANDYANHLYQFLACLNTTPSPKQQIPLTIDLSSADEGG